MFCLHGINTLDMSDTHGLKTYRPGIDLSRMIFQPRYCLVRQEVVEYTSPGLHMMVSLSGTSLELLTIRNYFSSWPPKNNVIAYLSGGSRCAGRGVKTPDVLLVSIPVLNSVY